MARPMPAIFISHLRLMARGLDIGVASMRGPVLGSFYPHYGVVIHCIAITQLQAKLRRLTVVLAYAPITLLTGTLTSLVFLRINHAAITFSSHVSNSLIS